MFGYLMVNGMKWAGIGWNGVEWNSVIVSLCGYFYDRMTEKMDYKG